MESLRNKAQQKPLRVCTYSRVSTSNKDQKPEVQVEELRRYCAARSWGIEHEIVDHGYSGGTDVRPGLKQLIQLVQSRQVDVVVVVKLDRLFRSLRHLVTTLDDFHSVGVQLVAVKDSVDYTTPAGRLFVQVLGSLAEFEKALLVERTLMGLAHARAKGKRLGRPPKAQEGDIRGLRAQGASYRAIRRKLGCGMGSIRRALAAPKSVSGKTAKVPDVTEGGRG
jgi:DNA invertase Pin-like site-specific DNA recombinase